MDKVKCVFGQKLGLVPILAAALMSEISWAENSTRWFRGQLHTHTYWSDGRGFPEQAIAAYKQRDYHFLCMTEHNRFADNPDEWREVKTDEGGWPPNVTQAIFDSYARDFAKDWVETRASDSGTSVRLKTYAECKAKFEEPGKFLLMPGVEVTQALNKFGVHLNYINLPLVIPCVNGADLIKNIKAPMTVSELISLNATETKKAADELKRPYMLIVNHPQWIYYDIVPKDFIDCPEIRFFEVCNGGSDHAPHPLVAEHNEKLWDVVNAFRVLHGNKALYGIASDDAHYYDAKRIGGTSGVGDAWIMVRAASLAPDHLMEAMGAGDFYASSGVLLDDVSFQDKTLRIKVKQDDGVNYRIHFVTTKQGFNQGMSKISSPSEKKRPARFIPQYADDIGRTVKTTTGVDASYKLETDDLYVRARIESDSPSQTSPHFHPKVKTAWTQPYTHKSVSVGKTIGLEPKRTIDIDDQITKPPGIPAVDDLMMLKTANSLGLYSKSKGH